MPGNDANTICNAESAGSVPALICATTSISDAICAPFNALLATSTGTSVAIGAKGVDDGAVIGSSALATDAIGDTSLSFNVATAPLSCAI